MFKKLKKSDLKFYIFIIIGCLFAVFSLIMPFVAYNLSKDFDNIVINKEEVLRDHRTGLGLLPEETLKDYLLELGPLGDLTAGTTVPFLTFAGFIILIGTMFMQKSELELTRNELLETQKIFKEQSETMVLQRFENTFFQLLSLHNENVRSMTIEVNNNPYPYNIRPERQSIDTYSGRYIFPQYKQFLFRYLRPIETMATNEIDGLHQLFIGIRHDYYEFFKKNKPELGHYFRNLYRFIKFIDDFKGLTKAIKSEYVDLIRAQLSSDEMTLLIYNGFSKEGEAFLKYMKEYDFLDGVDESYVHDKLVLKLFNQFDEVQEFDEFLKQQQTI